MLFCAIIRSLKDALQIGSFRFPPSVEDGMLSIHDSWKQVQLCVFMKSRLNSVVFFLNPLVPRSGAQLLRQVELASAVGYWTPLSSCR